MTTISKKVKLTKVACSILHNFFEEIRADNTIDKSQIKSKIF